MRVDCFDHVLGRKRRVNWCTEAYYKHGVPLS